MDADRSGAAPAGDGRRQRRLLAVLVFVYLVAAVAYVLLPAGMDASAAALGVAGTTLPRWQLALANGVGILVIYGGLGLVGLALARRAGIPGMLRRDAAPRAWLGVPLATGAAAGVGMVVVDRVSALAPGFEGFDHPPFPASLLASLTAGLGEEILFRGFVMTLWAALFVALARRLGRPGARRGALAAANALAALAFTAAHLGTASVLAGVADPRGLPPVMLLDLLLINGGLGWVAGRAALRVGVVAAVGVHFWADIVWHVLYPALAGR